MSAVFKHIDGRGHSGWYRFELIDSARVPTDRRASIGSLDLADLKEGETARDLGSGSGMDTFIAALKVGSRGKVIGVDMTDEQRAKAERLLDRDGVKNVTYVARTCSRFPERIDPSKQSMVLNKRAGCPKCPLVYNER
jgi:precorrin-6B methylase 2